jgi:transcriptional regulator with XRE-family HTH domain
MRVVTRAALRRRAPSAEVPYIPPELDGITKRLVEARERAGLTVTDAGTSRLERGYRLKNLSAVVAVRIAKQLGVSVGWLLTGEGTQRPTVPPPSSRPRHPASIRAEEIDEE